jgi:hypothetical protein
MCMRVCVQVMQIHCVCLWEQRWEIVRNHVCVCDACVRTCQKVHRLLAQWRQRALGQQLLVSLFEPLASRVSIEDIRTMLKTCFVARNLPYSPVLALSFHAFDTLRNLLKLAT